MVPLMIGLTLEVYLVGRLILGSVGTSMAVAASLWAIFSTLWFGFPLFMGRFHSQDQSMHNLIELAPYGKNGEIQMVVETPRGSNLKLNYEPKLHAFTVSRALPLGLIYPYDWGFIPSTKGEDGDPIDALALHDGATYPGVVLPCHALGVVELVQEEKTCSPVQNPRVILMPVWHDRMGELERASDLPSRFKDEIE